MQPRRPRLRDLLPAKKVKTPGYGISGHFYLSVLANTATLPPLLTVVNPNGDAGAPKGFGVPLRADADKESLTQPMPRGHYAIASPDQKTVLQTTVIPVEEAGFQPDPFLNSESGKALPEDERARIKAAWHLVQLTFKSFDPTIYPALDFLLVIARRLGELTDGIIADPISQTYKLPSDLISARPESEKFSVQDHVAVKSRFDQGRLHCHTLGLQKFGLAEFEMSGVPTEIPDVAERFLLGLSKTSMNGVKIEPGETAGSPARPIQIAEGGFDKSLWEGIRVLELIPEGGWAIEESLLAWSAENP